MKNLKLLLSLTLVVVMLSAMVVVPSAASTITINEVIFRQTEDLDIVDVEIEFTAPVGTDQVALVLSTIPDTSDISSFIYINQYTAAVVDGILTFPISKAKIASIKGLEEDDVDGCQLYVMMGLSMDGNEICGDVAMQEVTLSCVPMQIPVEGISLDENFLKLIEGEQHYIRAEVMPYNASNKELVWLSDDNSVATVEKHGEEDGLVRAEGKGETVIRVLTADGAFEASCSVVVDERPPVDGGEEGEDGGFSPSEPDFDENYEYGEYKNFEYEIRNGNLKILWYSGNEKNIIIPETINGYPVTEISDWAFSNSLTLESIVIPASVTEIGSTAFAWCENLEKIEVVEGNANYITIDNVLFTSDMNTLIQYPTKKTTKNYTIPEGIREIVADAFANCDFIETIKLPASLRSMDDSTFSWCFNLNKIEVADGNIRFVAENGILFNENKTTLIQYPAQKAGASYTVPDGVRIVASHAFVNSRLEQITIPSSVKKVFGTTFAFCHYMKNIEVAKANEYYTSVDGVLFDKDKTEIIKYPGEKNGASYTIPSTVTQIGENAFYMSRKLTSVTIPEGIEYIGLQAFSYCDGLKSIVIPSTVKKIDEYAFSDCTSLKTIIIPKSITRISHGVFALCENLKTVNYQGSKSQWREIDIAEENEPLLRASINYGYEYGNNDDESDDKEDVKEYKIVINGTETVSLGKTVTFSAYAYYEENGKIIKTKDAIEWYSADEDIATVSKGKVKGVGAGSTTITAYIRGTDIFETFNVTVAVPVKKLKFESTKATVYVGNDLDLSEGMTINPEEHTDVIVWETSNEDVAIVDEFGVVTPIATGSAKITAKAIAGNKKATCTVTVSRTPEGIILDGNQEVAVAQGKTATLKAYAYYEENGKIIKTKDAIEWYSADEDIATVSKGKVKGVDAGTTTITAYIRGTDIFETFNVTVAVPVKKLKFESTKATVYVGNDLDLSEGMTINPEEHTDVIVWETSNEDVAIVDEFGVVTPIATGSAKITAKAIAGNKKATCTVTVSRTPEGIILDGNQEVAVAQGKTATLKAYAYYEENGKIIKTKDAIEWYSADEDIATVSKGKVKGVDAGTTTITAYIRGTDIFETFNVTVAVPVKKLKFESTKATVYVGNDLDLSEGMTINPEEHTDVIVWETSNEDVAIVDEFGVVTPIATGSAKITAKAIAGNKKATCTVTVSRTPEGIILDGNQEVAVAQGKTATLKAYAYYEENGKIIKTKDAIEWYSADEDIATVSKGKVKGVGAGSTTITAYIRGTDIFETFNVTVAVPVKKINLTQKKLEAVVDDVIDLNEFLVVTPFENTDKLIWTTSDENVATVEDGIVTFNNTGKVKITVKAVAGKKSAYTTITVKGIEKGEDIVIENTEEQPAELPTEQPEVQQRPAEISYYDDSPIPKYESITGSPQVTVPISFPQSNAICTMYFYDSNEAEKDQYIDFLYEAGWKLNGIANDWDSRGDCIKTGFRHYDSNGEKDAQVVISYFPSCGDVDVMAVLPASR